MNSAIKDRVEKIDQGIVPEGYKKTKVGIIPGDWEVKKLGEVSEVVSGGTPSTMNVNYWNGDIPWATPTDITGNGKFISHTSRKITNEGLKKSSANLLPINSILMTSRATVGERSINLVEMTTNQGFKSFICGKKLNYEYLYYLIEVFKNEFIRMASGSTFLEINKKDTENIKIPIPPLQEQEKIADILSTWDKAIENIEKLIKEKEMQKKGLMQELLTGETRLPGFNGEWKEVKLGRISQIIMGQSPKSENYNNQKIGLPLIQGNADMKLGYTNPKIYTSEITKVCEIGDIIMSVRAPVGNLVISKHKACIGRGVCSIEGNKFLYYYLLSNNDKLKRYSQGSTFESINSSDLNNLLLNLPPLPEQKAIAEILSTADKEIELLKKLLTNKKQEKKGLMQLLLTGIVRVQEV